MSYLLKSTKNSSFGTAFCIKQDTKGSYFVTCTHVVEDCGIDSLTIEQHQAKERNINKTNNMLKCQA